MPIQKKSTSAKFWPLLWVGIIPFLLSACIFPAPSQANQANSSAQTRSLAEDSPQQPPAGEGRPLFAQTNSPEQEIPVQDTSAQDTIGADGENTSAPSAETQQSPTDFDAESDSSNETSLQTTLEDADASVPFDFLSDTDADDAPDSAEAVDSGEADGLDSSSETGFETVFETLPDSSDLPEALETELELVEESANGSETPEQTPDEIPFAPSPAQTSALNFSISPGNSEGSLLSAFFGFYDEVPDRYNLDRCRGLGSGTDGIWVVFSQEIEDSTLHPSDFHVRTRSGMIGTVDCATLFPAVDLGEKRTVLLIGDFGSNLLDPPTSLEILGTVLALDENLDFHGASVQVRQPGQGPQLVFAEQVPQEQWKLGVSSRRTGSGTGCPAGTVQAIRAVWSASITRPDGSEAGHEERLAYTVNMRNGDASVTPLVPFSLADLGDGDNNHLLCLDQMGVPMAVAFQGGLLVAPSGNTNPTTSTSVDRRGDAIWP